MTKKEMLKGVKATLEENNKSYKVDEIQDVIDGYVEFLTFTMQEHATDEKVPLPNVGNFIVRKVEEAVSRNPNTGENILVPTHYIPKIRFSKNFRDKCR